MSSNRMEKFLKDNASLGVLISFLMLIVVPAIITGLQIGYTAATAPLAQYPGTVIAFSVLFYILIIMLAASAHLMSVESHLRTLPADALPALEHPAVHAQPEPGPTSSSSSCSSWC